MGGILVLAGGVLCLIGGLLIAIAAFKESVLWGIGCLIIPIVGLIFVITHFEESKGGLMAYVAGIIAVVAGTVMGGGGG
ncbi:MAG: hypothetical protein KIS92_25950 [Planctomycetota bacterium]|nr:hypothetical protein [Planctomycetota bacterium]